MLLLANVGKKQVPVAQKVIADSPNLTKFRLHVHGQRLKDLLIIRERRSRITNASNKQPFSLIYILFIDHVHYCGSHPIIVSGKILPRRVSQRRCIYISFSRLPPAPFAFIPCVREASHHQQVTSSIPGCTRTRINRETITAQYMYMYINSDHNTHIDTGMGYRGMHANESCNVDVTKSSCLSTCSNSSFTWRTHSSNSSS